MPQKHLGEWDCVDFSGDQHSKAGQPVWDFPHHLQPCHPQGHPSESGEMHMCCWHEGHGCSSRTAQAGRQCQPLSLGAGNIDIWEEEEEEEEEVGVSDISHVWQQLQQLRRLLSQETGLKIIERGFSRVLWVHRPECGRVISLGARLVL